MHHAFPYLGLSLSNRLSHRFHLGASGNWSRKLSRLRSFPLCNQPLHLFDLPLETEDTLLLERIVNTGNVRCQFWRWSGNPQDVVGNIPSPTLGITLVRIQKLSGSSGLLIDVVEEILRQKVLIDLKASPVVSRFLS